MKFIRKVTFPRATRLISTAAWKSKEADERSTDSTFSRDVHLGEASLLSKPTVTSRKIEGKHRDCQAEKEESQRNGVITDTKNFAGTSGD